MIRSRKSKGNCRGRRVAVVLLGFAAVTGVAASRPAPARAGSTYCTTQGNRTYCDDGRAYYRYGNDIVSKDGRRWHDFGKHVYGPDGDWIAKHGKKGVTSSLRSGPGDEAAILPRIIDREDADADDEGEGGDD
jgi:hypothetical protein